MNVKTSHRSVGTYGTVFCAFAGNNELYPQVESRDTVLMELWAEF